MIAEPPNTFGRIEEKYLVRTDVRLDCANSVIKCAA